MARAAGGGAGFDAALSVRTQLWRLVVALVLVAAVASQVGPWGPAVRSELGERVGRVLPSSGASQ